MTYLYDLPFSHLDSAEEEKALGCGPNTAPIVQHKVQLQVKRTVSLGQGVGVQYLLDWAVLASMGWVKTPRPISERAARENM